MDKQGTQFILVILCSARGTDIARVEGLWLINRPNHSVPETQTTALRFMCALLIYFPPNIAQEITVTSFHDVMIICSNLKVGKPLCMHRGNAIVCLCICWHHHQSPQLLQLHLNLIVISLIQISCLWHSPPRYFGVPSYQSLNLFVTCSTKHRQVQQVNKMVDAKY